MSGRKLAEIVVGRMERFGLSVSELAEKSFISEYKIQHLISGHGSIDILEEIEVAWLESTLSCRRGYFTNKKVRESDFVNAIPQECASTEAVEAIARLQRFTDNLSFIDKVYEEFREPTQEERKSVSDYIDSISECVNKEGR